MCFSLSANQGRVFISLYMKKQSSFSIIVTILIVLVIDAFWWEVLQVNPSTQANNTAATPIIVTAAKIKNDYTSNEISADSQYKGQFVEVSGFIQSINKSVWGSPYIVLADSPQGWGDVQCSFGQSDETTLAALSAGNPITVEGTGNGYAVGEVLIDSCSIVPNASSTN